MNPAAPAFAAGALLAWTPLAWTSLGARNGESPGPVCAWRFGGLGALRFPGSCGAFAPLSCCAARSKFSMCAFAAVKLPYTEPPGAPGGAAASQGVSGVELSTKSFSQSSATSVSDCAGTFSSISSSPSSQTSRDGSPHAAAPGATSGDSGLISTRASSAATGCACPAVAPRTEQSEKQALAAHSEIYTAGTHQSRDRRAAYAALRTPSSRQALSQRCCGIEEWRFQPSSPALRIEAAAADAPWRRASPPALPHLHCAMCVRRLRAPSSAEAPPT